MSSGVQTRCNYFPRHPFATLEGIFGQGTNHERHSLVGKGETSGQFQYLVFGCFNSLSIVRIL